MTTDELRADADRRESLAKAATPPPHVQLLAPVRRHLMAQLADPTTTLASVERDRLLADCIERLLDQHGEWCRACDHENWPKDGCTWTGDRNLLLRFAALEAK